MTWLYFANVINNLNGERYSKVSSVDYGTKITIISQNKDKYPINAMCKFPNISISHYYNYKEASQLKDPLTETVKAIFRDSKKTYGTRRIKAKLDAKGYTVSRQRIGHIRANKGLVSVHTKAKYKVLQKSMKRQLRMNLIENLMIAIH